MQIFLTVVGVILLILVLLYFVFKNRIKDQLNSQQSMIDEYKQSMQLFIISKKKDKLSNAKLPKGALEQIPKLMRNRKVALVKAKVGSQVMTLLCDDKIYKTLPEKKTIVAEVAGIYIVGIKKVK
ncbi:MAG: hypothetical protein N4A47_05005 [Clostridia bacterium]|jgi:hypothetical protein|nr:hypothetical protein [Clostridia bacterium]